MLSSLNILRITFKFYLYPVLPYIPQTLYWLLYDILYDQISGQNALPREAQAAALFRVYDGRNEVAFIRLCKCLPPKNSPHQNLWQNLISRDTFETTTPMSWLVHIILLLMSRLVFVNVCVCLNIKQQDDQVTPYIISGNFCSTKLT